MKKKKRRFLPKVLLLSLILSLAVPLFAFASGTDHVMKLDTNVQDDFYFYIPKSTGVNISNITASSNNSNYGVSVSLLASGKYPNYNFISVSVTNGGNALSSSDYVTIHGLDTYSYTGSRYTAKDSSGTWVVTKSYGGSSDLFNDITVSGSTNQIYSDYAFVVPDTTAPADVTNTTATNVSDTGLTLNWSASVSSDVSAYQVYKGLELLGTTALTSYNISGLTPSTAYQFTIKAVDGSNNVSSGVTVNYSTVAAPVVTDPNQGGDSTLTQSLFPSLVASGITTQAESWANNFDSLLLVVVGVGLGFAAVRFVKGLFF